MLYCALLIISRAGRARQGPPAGSTTTISLLHSFIFYFTSGESVALNSDNSSDGLCQKVDTSERSLANVSPKTNEARLTLHAPKMLVQT